jgi:hypothetical protein
MTVGVIVFSCAAKRFQLAPRNGSKFAINLAEQTHYLKKTGAAR